MEKTCIKNMGVWYSFEKNETATMFFLKKPSLVVISNFICKILYRKLIHLAVKEGFVRNVYKAICYGLRT